MLAASFLRYGVLRESGSAELNNAECTHPRDFLFSIPLLIAVRPPRFVIGTTPIWPSSMK